MQVIIASDQPPVQILSIIMMKICLQIGGLSGVFLDKLDFQPDFLVQGILPVIVVIGFFFGPMTSSP